jgi:hypothetical protein
MTFPSSRPASTTTSLSNLICYWVGRAPRPRPPPDVASNAHGWQWVARVVDRVAARTEALAHYAAAHEE